jgi:single-strand DNA-binding protein
MNFIHIAGHLGADPETRFTSTGKKVTTLRLGSRARKGGKDETIWWRVSVWGEQFDKMMPHLKKGSAVMVFGEVHKPEIFNDREGKPQVSMDITATYIQFSPFGKPGGSGSEGQSQQHSGPAANNPYMGSSAPVGAPQGMGETFDDEVPF